MFYKEQSARCTTVDVKQESITDNSYIVEVINEHNTIMLDKEQPSLYNTVYVTTNDVKNESLFELIDAYTDMLDNQQHSLDNTLYVKEESLFEVNTEQPSESLFAFMNERNTKFDKEQPSNTTVHVKQESLFELMNELYTTVDYSVKQESVDYSVEVKHESRFFFKCGQCDYLAKRRDILKQHVKVQHEVRYSCDQCDYKATQISALKRHVDTKHAGIFYACDQCDYKATRRRDLQRHLDIKHEGICYSCDQ